MGCRNTEAKDRDEATEVVVQGCDHIALDLVQSDSLPWQWITLHVVVYATHPRYPAMNKHPINPSPSRVAHCP